VCTDAHSTAAAAAAATTAGTASTAGATATAAGAADTSSVRSVFAVFDGHGSKGREASALCAARLEKALTARLTQLTSGNSSGNSNPACSLSSVGMSFSGSSASLSIHGSTSSTATTGSPYSSITSSSGSNSSDKIGPVGCTLAYVCWQLQKELQSTAKLDCANVNVYCHIRQLYCSAIIRVAPRPTYCGNTDFRLYMPAEHGVTELCVQYCVQYCVQ
jgi:serine/threonine protein phosphatase PrpC